MSNLNERFIKLCQRLQATTSKNEKQAILVEFKDDDEIKELLHFRYNPYIITGISEKKLKKHLLCEQGTHTDLLALTGYLRQHNSGRDADVKHCLTYVTDPLIYGLIKKDLNLGIDAKTCNKAFGPNFIPTFEVMLAEKYFDRPTHVQDKEFILTEKLDGIRCVCMFADGTPKFFSRQGQPIEGLEELEEEVLHLASDFVYDGELLLNNNTLRSEDLYRATVKVVNGTDAKTNIIFNMFDMVSREGFQKGIDKIPCKVRKQNLLAHLERIQQPHLKPVLPLYQGTDVQRISHFLEILTDSGKEGVMLNLADSPYECKRTWNLLKIKKFNTADVLVKSIEEGSGTNKGSLGAAHIEFIGPDNKHYTCKVGSGFTLEERATIWANPELIIGKIIEIGYFEFSKNQDDDSYSLRFPTFKHIRADKTCISMH